MMRQNELKEGVSVEDASGNVVGSSVIAAKKVWRYVVLWTNNLTTLLLQNLLKNDAPILLQ